MGTLDVSQRLEARGSNRVKYRGADRGLSLKWFPNAYWMSPGCGAAGRLRMQSNPPGSDRRYRDGD